MNDNFDENQLDEIFDENKLDRAIRKGKRKSTKKTILISLVVATFVFIFVTVGNSALTINMSNKAYQWMDAYVQLTVPNGYISKSIDTFSFLGGRSDYTISRTVGGKPVILENRVQGFGFLPQLIMTRQQGGAGQVAGQWPTNYWEYGYNKMIFFHPDITYKEYKNDLVNLSKISNDKLIEVGVSLDRPYKISEISKILPDVNISWYWVDAFRKEDLERYEKEAVEYDAKATYINEFNVLGVNMRPSQGVDSFATNYNSLLYSLKTSQDPKFSEIFSELNAEGYTDSSKVPILGAIVYGTKDQLKSLLGNPHIKASSFGVIVDKY